MNTTGLEPSKSCRSSKDPGSPTSRMARGLGAAPTWSPVVPNCKGEAAGMVKSTQTQIFFHCFWAILEDYHGQSRCLLRDAWFVEISLEFIEGHSRGLKNLLVASGWLQVFCMLSTYQTLDAEFRIVQIRRLN